MKKIILLIVIIVFFIGGIYISDHVKKWLGKDTGTITYVKVPEIKEVIKYKTVKVPVKEVVTYEKEKVVEKLKLPDWIIKDENKQVITTGEIKSYRGKTDVVTVLDTKTGESEMIAKQRPLPFIGIDATLSAYLEMKVMGSDYAQPIRMGLQLDTVRIKGNTVIYVKAETGMAKRAIVNDYRPYGAVYAGIRHEIGLLK